MSEIDIQNAKQIRDPMTVLITMEVPDTDITLTFSGYSSAKVADGVLNHQDWPMRQLADLQGDGFPLDGSRVLYDSATSASAANGKIGVRSNVGETVSVTVTGSGTITNLSIFATGAESVTYNGTTSAIVGGQAIIPVGATSITLTFNPASTTERIEVSAIIPGTSLRITNESLIRATVSLRSDLSLFDQTLPESELNVEVYNDADISEIVASIPEDTPITYQAGYEGDMSPVRNFYVSGQVTWAENVLTIQAVDAVHFLDNMNISAPLTEVDPARLMRIALYCLKKAGIDPHTRFIYFEYPDNGRWIVREGTTAKDLIAFMNQCFSITDDNGYLIDGTGKVDGSIMFSYVDAGIPDLRTYRFGKRRIKENDCASIKKNIEPITGVVKASWEELLRDAMDETEGRIAKVGSATFLKTIGASLSFDQYTYSWKIGLFAGRNYDNDVATKMIDKYGVLWGYGYMVDVVPTNSIGNEQPGPMPTISLNEGSYDIATMLLKGEVPQNEFGEWPTSTPPEIFSSFVPWAQSYSSWRYDNNSSHVIQNATQMWKVLTDAKILDSGAESIDLDIYGWALYTDTKQKVYTRDAASLTYEYEELPILGRVLIKKEGGAIVRMFPDKALAAPMYRSPITYSFTWKGDPRMQPRDIIEWERLDGTEEEITLETITITHEGGGTSAEITARKGIV